VTHTHGLSGGGSRVEALGVEALGWRLSGGGSRGGGSQVEALGWRL